MKEFKYTIDGKEYKVQIDAVEGNIASVNVNGEAYKVEMEQEAEPEKKKGWVCTICGYIHEDEILPPDFICPVCSHPAEFFKKIE